jgi:hypothetical protein
VGEGEYPGDAYVCRPKSSTNILCAVLASWCGYVCAMQAGRKDSLREYEPGIDTGHGTGNRRTMYVHPVDGGLASRSTGGFGIRMSITSPVAGVFTFLLAIRTDRKVLVTIKVGTEKH